jgi:hypothetical protein
MESFPWQASDRRRRYELPADTLAGIVLPLEFSGQSVQVWTQESSPHPAQDVGLDEVEFDQVLLLSARLAEGEASQGYAE